MLALNGSTAEQQDPREASPEQVPGLRRPRSPRSQKEGERTQNSAGMDAIYKESWEGSTGQRGDSCQMGGEPSLGAESQGWKEVGSPSTWGHGMCAGSRVAATHRLLEAV